MACVPRCEADCVQELSLVLEGFAGKAALAETVQLRQHSFREGPGECV